MDLFQNMIHQSRYARWRPDLGRRETWNETVTRYFDFFQDHLESKHKYILTPSLRSELQEGVENFHFLPSMRALMTAGPALARCNVAGYNCAYVPIDHPRAFDEAMYILMCGTGVGFSVERQCVALLPSVAESFEKSSTTIVVDDSKEGWSKAYRELIAMLYVGQIPTWDMSKVRPAGAPLKTFGGRASGPAPLDDLFRFTVKKFRDAHGRRLSSLECHDLMCKIGEIVVVGGVRRSATISLSNLSDDRLRGAKSGQWWESEPQRALANNSVAYTEKPEVGLFMKEWLSLYESRSGERGLFNRVAAEHQVASIGRREVGHAWGTNPCLVGDSLLLTDKGLKTIGSLAETEGFLVLNGDQKFVPATAWATGVKPVFKVQLSNGLSFRATFDHRLEVVTKQCPSHDYFTKPMVVTVGDLTPGVKVRTFLGVDWTGTSPISEDEACLLGILLGDGYNYHGRVAIKTREQEVVDFLSSMEGITLSTTDEFTYVIQGVERLMSEQNVTLPVLPSRSLPAGVYEWSPDLVRALLRGLYSANGCSLDKHNRIMLKTTCEALAKQVQTFLIALGFPAYITTNASSEIEWPNGTYVSKESYDVNVSGADFFDKFQLEIGFLHLHKRHTTRPVPSRNRYKCAEVISVTPDGEETVYDFNEPLTHWGWVNGLKIHNCGEIILRPHQFCNLSEPVCRETDSYSEMKWKTQMATTLGTFQSTLTNFKYLRKIWQRNTEEERLLGVSLTGIMDSNVRGWTATQLDCLKHVAVRENEKLAAELGIPQSTAITCVKPSGTVSQLVNSSSGIHARHSPYYIRTVRQDNKDPMTEFMKDQNFPNEPCVSKPNDTTIFSFPIKAPEGAVTRNEMTAIEQLELWLKFKTHWCEHSPSVTITVREHEWLEVGAWVFAHFDEISGVSFLPHSEHIYRQAPYQECTKNEYEAMLEKMPKEIDWKWMQVYEGGEDKTVGSQTLACTGGSCELI